MNKKRRKKMKEERARRMYEAMRAYANLVSELKRGTGECNDCGTKFLFEEIKREFEITHPLTGETKISLLCRTCRKIWAEKLRRAVNKYKLRRK